MDFGTWFNRQQRLPVSETCLTDAQRHTQELLEAEIIEEGDGDCKWRCRCCVCGEWTDLMAGPDEIDLDYEHYCGGSPRCCP